MEGSKRRRSRSGGLYVVMTLTAQSRGQVKLSGYLRAETVIVLNIYPKLLKFLTSPVKCLMQTLDLLVWRGCSYLA